MRSERGRERQRTTARRVENNIYRERIMRARTIHVADITL